MPSLGGNGTILMRAVVASCSILLTSPKIYGVAASSIAVKKETSALAAVPTMADGKANQGFTYAALYELPGAGVQVMRGHVDPKGSIAVHDGPQQYILYVIAGTGKMTLNGKGGEQIGEITYKADDVIVFQPKTLHGWVNRDAAFEFLGFDMPVLRK
jgi:quercetin dioxygenase-like cupin family protein